MFTNCSTTGGEGKGLAILPLPSPADMFLDFEANPYVLDQGLEYLIGIVTLPANSGGDPIYESLWSSTLTDVVLTCCPHFEQNSESSGVIVPHLRQNISARAWCRRKTASIQFAPR